MTAPGGGASLSFRYIARFWSPLAATWIMMAAEGPLIAAAIARLPDPKINLAAHGVAFAIAILAEAPVIMLMTASTALVHDARSYRRLRLFTHGLNAAATLFLCVLLIPPLFEAFILGLLGLPRDIADLVRGALWIFLPWPAAIGYRRFIQGVMIRSGQTRRVAGATLFRLAVMASAAIALTAFSDLPGVWVGASSLTVGVLVEALAARLMGAAAIRSVLAEGGSTGGPAPLGYSAILAFYAPLVVTSILTLATHPILTFLVGRARAPIESLAVLPVVHAISFVFRAVGISYQEAAIALIGRRPEQRRAVSRFAAGLAVATSLAYALFALPPLFGFWFGELSALTPELIEYARAPAALLIPLPGLAVWLAYQSALLVVGRRTKTITAATSIGLGGIVAIFAVAAWGLGWSGVTAACLAFTGGRLLANLYLHWAEGG